jgi:hypothetical protein
MHVMQAPMFGDDESESLSLPLLAQRLVMEGMPVQQVIAREAKVSQSTVSRAVHSTIAGPSKGARKLWDYVNSRMAVLAQGAPGGEVPSDGVAVPFPPDALTQPEPRRRKPRMPRRRSDDQPVRITPAERARLADAALAGLKDYLEDAFDPQLVIDQLAVLRRAQDPGRRGVLLQDDG